MPRTPYLAREVFVDAHFVRALIERKPQRKATSTVQRHRAVKPTNRLRLTMYNDFLRSRNIARNSTSKRKPRDERKRTHDRAFVFVGNYHTNNIS